MSLKLSGSEFGWIQPQQQKVTCVIGALGIQSYCEDGIETINPTLKGSGFLGNYSKSTMLMAFTIPRHPVIFSADEQGVSFITETKRMGSFRFHETILSFGEPGSLGVCVF